MDPHAHPANHTAPPDEPPPWIRAVLLVAVTAVVVLAVAVVLVTLLNPRSRSASVAEAGRPAEPSVADDAAERPPPAAANMPGAGGLIGDAVTPRGAGESSGPRPPADAATGQAAGVVPAVGADPVPSRTASPATPTAVPAPGPGSSPSSPAATPSGTPGPAAMSGGSGGAGPGPGGGSGSSAGAGNTAAGAAPSNSPAGAGAKPPAGSDGAAPKGPRPAPEEPAADAGATGPSGTLRLPPRRPPTPRPVPPEDARRRAVEQLRTEWKELYQQATQPSGKRSVGLELFRRAYGESDDARRFALLDEFCAFAAESDDVTLALAAIRELETHYQTDGWPRRAAAVQRLLEAAPTEEQRRKLAETALSLAVDAADAGQAIAARDLQQSATTHAKQLKDAAAQRTLLAQARQLDARWAAQREADELRPKLARTPHDGSLNLQFGRALGLAESDWATGLRHLTRGTDRPLANLASLDLEGPPGEAPRLQLANLWYEQARLRRNDPKNRELCQARARAIYRQLLPRLAGTPREFVEQRLKELGAGPVASSGTVAVRPPLVSLPWLNGPAGEVRTFDGHQKNITALAIAPDGTLLASAAEDLTVQAWQLESGGRRWTATVETANAHGLAFSWDGQFVVGNLDNAKLRVWHADHGSVRGEIPTSGRSPTDIAVLPDNRRVIWGCRAQPPNIAVWDVREQRMWGQFGDGDTPTVLDLSDDGRLVVTADAHGMVRVWHVDTGLLLKEFRAHDDAVTDLSLAPGGQLVATATFGRVRVSVLATGEAVGSLTVPNVRTAAFSPDGRRLVTGGAREEVFLWDCDSGERLTSLRAEAAFSEGLILRLAFLPDPRGLVTGATGGKLRLWKLPD